MDYIVLICFDLFWFLGTGLVSRVCDCSWCSRIFCWPYFCKSICNWNLTKLSRFSIVSIALLSIWSLTRFTSPWRLPMLARCLKLKERLSTSFKAMVRFRSSTDSTSLAEICWEKRNVRQNAPCPVSMDIKHIVTDTNISIYIHTHMCWVVIQIRGRGGTFGLPVLPECKTWSTFHWSHWVPPPTPVARFGPYCVKLEGECGAWGATFVSICSLQ